MSDYTRVVNAADAWGSVPLTACGWCGVFVADPHLHTRWCPGQEHDRKMADYGKVYGSKIADGLREAALGKMLDHKEP